MSLRKLNDQRLHVADWKGLDRPATVFSNPLHLLDELAAIRARGEMMTNFGCVRALKFIIDEGGQCLWFRTIHEFHSD